MPLARQRQPRHSIEREPIAIRAGRPHWTIEALATRWAVSTRTVRRPDRQRSAPRHPPSAVNCVSRPRLSDRPRTIMGWSYQPPALRGPSHRSWLGAGFGWRTQLAARPGCRSFVAGGRLGDSAFRGGGRSPSAYGASDAVWGPVRLASETRRLDYRPVAAVCGFPSMPCRLNSRPLAAAVNHALDRLEQAIRSAASIHGKCKQRTKLRTPACQSSPRVSKALEDSPEVWQASQRWRPAYKSSGRAAFAGGPGWMPPRWTPVRSLNLRRHGRPSAWNILPLGR